MPTKSNKDSQPSGTDTKLQDFIKLLQLVERLYQSPLGMNPRIVIFIKQLKTTLAPYGEMKDSEFFELLSNALSSYDIKEIEINKEETSVFIDLEKVSFEDLRKLLAENILTKEQLLLIGEHRFGLAKGTHRKLSKEKIQDLIENAMQNLETLKIIKSKAGE